MKVPRYLVPVDYKSIAHYFTDVLILGSGLAGVRAALAVDESLSVAIVTKGAELEICSSTRAQGGIASVLDPLDNFEDHIADTLTAGAGLCDERVVRFVIEHGPARIHELIDWGTHFDLDENFHLDLTREGGHGFNRIAHALGDSTGKEIMRALFVQIKSRPNIHICTNTFAIDLITADNVCYGAILYSPQTGMKIVWAKQVILATGGSGQLYRETTNPEVTTADGMAMAYRAGARLRGLEFVQFHPTVLYLAGGARSLISEAVRGEGAHLIDKNGYRFMPDYDSRAELAPRDIVSRSIVAQMAKTNSSCVYLTLKHLDTAFVHRRFPGIESICHQFDLDLAKDNIPIRPGAHYMMGGIEVDLDAKTNIEGLRAVGEVTSTGLHGANRLASNSLLEAVVFGKIAGEGASIDAKRAPKDYVVFSLEGQCEPTSGMPLDTDDIRNTLKSVMQRCVGVMRDKDGLQEANDTFMSWQKFINDYQFKFPRGWELQNMLTICRLIAHCALIREETRGGHSRSDFPEQSDNWKKYTVVERVASGDENDITEPLEN
ncbi:MAG: L-aspartate oxidase [Thermoguttaceae bacterium]|nr:L-aspartate oxidase [Thermoguttaceae bacterium]